MTDTRFANDTTINLEATVAPVAVGHRAGVGAQVYVAELGGCVWVVGYRGARVAVKPRVFTDESAAWRYFDENRKIARAGGEPR